MRIAWQCRRGMCELDDLLQNFFRRQYDQLSQEESHAFEALLPSPDPLLLDYLMGRSVPEEREIAELVVRIRSAVTP